MLAGGKLERLGLDPGTPPEPVCPERDAVFVEAPQLAGVPVQGAANGLEDPIDRRGLVGCLGQHAAHFVLELRALGGLLGAPQEQSGLDRRGSPPAEIGGELEIAFAEVGAAPDGQQAERAVHVVATGQRHSQERAQVGVSEQRQVLLVACRLDEERVGDLRDEQRLSGVDHLLDCAAAGRVAAGRLLGDPHLLRIPVREGQRPQLAVVVDDPDDAPVGDRRDCELGDLHEDLLVVEGRRQHPARIGKEAKTPRGVGAVGDVAEEVDCVENPAGRAGDGEGVDERPASGLGIALTDADQHLRRMLPVQRELPGQIARRKGVPVLVEELEAQHHLRKRRGEQLLGRAVAAESCARLVRVDQLASRALHRDAVTEPVEHQPEVLAECECTTGSKVRFDRHRPPPMVGGPVVAPKRRGEVKVWPAAKRHGPPRSRNQRRRMSSP